jgi:hypothetical protein
MAGRTYPCEIPSYLPPYDRIDVEGNGNITAVLRLPNGPQTAC